MTRALFVLLPLSQFGQVIALGDRTVWLHLTGTDQLVVSGEEIEGSVAIEPLPDGRIAVSVDPGTVYAVRGHFAGAADRWGTSLVLDPGNLFGLQGTRRLALRFQAGEEVGPALREELWRFSIQDPSTGVGSRAWLIWKWPTLDLPLSMLWIDLDDFKRFNDRHGHQAGDSVLVGVAETLVANVPEGAALARVSGGGFAVVIPGPAEAGRTLAESLRAAVDAGRYAHRGRHPEADLRMTVSVGVVAFALRTDYAAAARLTEEAMLEAKRAGRNRVKAGSGS